MINILLDGELLKEVKCFKYLEASSTVDGKIETEVKSKVNEVEKVQDGINRLIGCR